MEKLISKIEETYALFIEEAKKSDNKSAQRRARKASSELGKLCKDFRQESLAK